MKKLFLLIVIIFLTLFGFSQNKKIDAIKKYYEKGKYEKCIAKAKDYILKDKSEAAPYFFTFLSFLKEYEIYKDHFSVKMAAKNLHKAMEKKQGDELKKQYQTEIEILHRLLKEYAYNYYEANKEKSKSYYDYLAKIYNDTLDQYYEIVLEKKNRPDADIIEYIKKGELNRTDENGLKQGKWTKVYPNGVTAYEVVFKDDKPIGKYKRYHENGQLSSVLNFDETGTNAKAEFYNQAGQKISEGQYSGKKKIGKWTYFKNDIIIKEENYTDGMMQGEQITYYNNGQIYDKKRFESGKQNGIWEKYHRNGKPYLKAFFKDGLLDGSIIRYYPNGLTEVKGQYKNDLKEGIWTFYSEDGNKETIEYKNGKDINEDEADRKYSEEYKKNIEKGKTIADPAHYQNNPQDFPINNK